MSDSIRLGTRMVLLGLILFGTLAYGWYLLLFTPADWEVLWVVLAVVLLGRFLPRPIAWVVMFGRKREV